MRFHIGFSKRISKKTIIFLLGLVSMALAMFFGNTEIVFAAEQSTNQCPGYMAYYRDNATDAITSPVQQNTYDCYIPVSNYGGFNGYNFTASYDFGGLCSSKRADLTIRFNLLNANFGYIPYNLNLQVLSNNVKSFQATQMSNGQITIKFSNVNLTQPLTVRVNDSTSTHYAVDNWVTGKGIIYECITDVAESINNASQDIINNNNQNTTTIINNQNQNTQDIIDNQNSDNVSTATTTGSNLFGNFHIDDTRGLTSVITAPIRLLQGIINSNDSCDSYTFNIQILGTESKTVSLPSGCILWNNVPSLVVVSYWVIVWAIVGYRCLVDMIHFTSSLRDPDHKNDYTLDL